MYKAPPFFCNIQKLCNNLRSYTEYSIIFIMLHILYSLFSIFHVDILVLVVIVFFAFINLFQIRTGFCLSSIGGLSCLAFSSSKDNLNAIAKSGSMFGSMISPAPPAPPKVHITTRDASTESTVLDQDWR